MSIIKHVTLQKIVAHDFRYDPRVLTLCLLALTAGNSSRRWHQYTAVEVMPDGTAISIFAEKNDVRYISH